ncbi:Mannosidase [Bifidobacterium anseris]|uniref:beta-mannosidase n=1 Tax=Bifidobacterium anseris TaxID=2020963 RepID=A0A2N5IXL7_9BIFI|nr:glycoside hydrolase family 2 TIM barrel-domain containing protein [Bifidobacterium anseris]PLS26703.1 Mannosidase [Bifidobacterium anseris]
MTNTSSTFAPLSSGWTVTAMNPEVAPADLREKLTAGIPATVPGEATLDLLNAGLIPDPFDGDNENKLQWTGDVDWRFTCTFEWHDDSNTRHDLVAYGLDTVATIELNGDPVAQTENCHRSYRWDVRDLLRDGENVLTVTFMSPVRYSDAEEQRRGYYPHTEHHAFNQIRKPSYSFGWDWGIDVANAGIWREIGIDSWSGVRLAEVRPLVDVASDGTGILNVHIKVEREGHGRIMNPMDAHKFQTPVPVHVTLEGYGTMLEADGSVDQGRDETTITIAVPDAKLWWPLGYGEQPLYAVDVKAGADLQAEWKGRIGFRTTHVDTRADDLGRPFQIYVNDVPVHAHGYNWIPDDAFIARVTKKDYERGIRDLVESNSNMVRVWGGGIYEADEFYDLCDEYGIMVWQDFMLACAAYPEDPETKEEVEAEAREAIVRLSSHPSLIVWNGSNENYVAYAEWGGYKQAVRDDDLPANEYGYGEKGWGDYYYSELFPQLLAELDPTHVYLPSSPMSFTKFTNANWDTDGTMHIWDAWNRKDYRIYAEYTPRFADEFGYQAPPAWSTLVGAVHDEKLEPFGKQMLVHQKAMGGNYKLARGMRSHLTPGQLDDVSFGGVVNGKPSDGEHSWLIPTDDWADIQDWHWACQLQQAHAMKFGVEHMRSLAPVNAGALIWQLNDDWPVVSWAAVDFNGHRKPMWYASRDFFAPRLATIQPRTSEEYRQTHSWEGVKVGTDHFELIVLNDTREPVKDTWTVQRVTLGGDVLATQTIDVDLDATSHKGYTLNDDIVAYDDPNAELIVATPSDDSFARVVYNPAEVVDQSLAAPGEAFTADAKKVDGGVELTVTAKDYVRDLFVMVDKVDPKASVEEGLVSLLPGESVTFHITTDADDPQAFAAANVLRSANDLKREAK